MEKRQFGNTDMRVSLLGFGGAEIGYEEADQSTVDTLLNSALDAGLNVIDTAECYVDSEEKIGKAVAGRRDQFYLFTKCGHETDDDGALKGKWDKSSLLKSIEQSLKRLQTDVVDLVQLHSCSLEELQKGEVIEALQEARNKGYTRYIGYSGDSAAARYAIETNAFDALQTSINIADQESIELTVPLTRERHMGLIAKRPVANAAWRSGKKPDEPYHHVYWDRLQELKYPFLEKSLPESIAIAMRFTASIPGVHTMIVGTTKPGRWSENAEILKQGSLSMEEFEEIRKRWHDTAGVGWTGQT